jgi:hypothetical protein
MNIYLTRQERDTLLFILAVIGIGLLLPPIPQPESYHHFADQRSWGAIPNAADVISNSIFIAAGALGLYRLKQPLDEIQQARLPLSVFFLGLVLTGAGSAYYHWIPNSQTILVDRLPMVIAFAGVIGAFLAQRVSVWIGVIRLIAGLGVGAVGLIVSAATGNLALYLALQFGGLAGLVIGLLVFKNGNDPIPWWALIAWYAVAKTFELGDHAVWDFTQQMVSGHTLKHLAAGMAGVVLVQALSKTGRSPLGTYSEER